MKILEINTVPFGSTAKIMLGVAEAAREQGDTPFMSCCPARYALPGVQGNYIPIGSVFGRRLHSFLARFTGTHGCFSYFATRRFLKKVKKISPDVLHLHNLHGGFINIPLLFRYIKKYQPKVIWTLHDCWSFTGQCPHFDMIGCEKWETACFDCPQCNTYPKTYIDRSRSMHKRKKKWFSGVADMTIVTPSHWLADLAKRSFLKSYPIQVIHNGIDLSVFRPTDSDFRKQHHCESKHILLGVSFDWGYAKGLDVFVELAKRLPPDYQIVLVGTNEETDKLLPPNILSIHRTQDQAELAKIYTAADVFVNPTRQDTFPTVNIEALACGTPVLTFQTGGSPEILTAATGSVVPKNDVDAMEKELLRILSQHPYSREDCRKQAEKFDKRQNFKEYLRLL